MLNSESGRADGTRFELADGSRSERPEPHQEAARLALGDPVSGDRWSLFVHAGAGRGLPAPGRLRAHPQTRGFDEIADPARFKASGVDQSTGGRSPERSPTLACDPGLR